MRAPLLTAQGTPTSASKLSSLGSKLLLERPTPSPLSTLSREESPDSKLQQHQRRDPAAQTRWIPSLSPKIHIMCILTRQCKARDAPPAAMVIASVNRLMVAFVPVHDKDSLKVLSLEPLKKLQTDSYPRARRGGLLYPRKGSVPEFGSPLSTANCRVQATSILDTRKDYHLAGRTLPQYGQIIDHGELRAPFIIPIKLWDDRASLIVLPRLGRYISAADPFFKLFPYSQLSSMSETISSISFC